MQITSTLENTIYTGAKKPFYTTAEEGEKMAEKEVRSKDIMEFWFYQWMIEEKKITFDDYCSKSDKDIGSLYEEFLDYYKSISKE